jgi:hypothetical protein
VIPPSPCHLDQEHRVNGCAGDCAGDCAQPGDNLVDQWVVSVGKAVKPWDGVWVPRVTITPIPTPRTAKPQLSTPNDAYQTAPDLRQRSFSTLSTAPMTTSLRQGLSNDNSCMDCRG